MSYTTRRTAPGGGLLLGGGRGLSAVHQLLGFLLLGVQGAAPSVGGSGESTLATVAAGACAGVRWVGHDLDGLGLGGEEAAEASTAEELGQTDGGGDQEGELADGQSLEGHDGDGEDGEGQDQELESSSQQQGQEVLLQLEAACKKKRWLLKHDSIIYKYNFVKTARRKTCLIN